MPSSQHSYDSLLNRFVNANALIQSWSDYNATNAYITKTALNTLEGNLGSANLLVATTLEPVDEKREQRNQLCFKIIGVSEEVTNPNCLEMRIDGVANYLKGELGRDSAAYKAVFKIVRRLRPNYKKKEPEEPRGAGNSPMERSFLSLVGQADTVIAILGTLAVYSPPDANLTILALTNLVNQIRQLNKDIAVVLETYGNANRTRKKLYNSKGNPPGLDQRVRTIKYYLASFPGGKKSDHYIEFTQAINGV